MRNAQGLAKNSILPNSDTLSLSAAEAKYIGLIGKELLLGALDRRFPIKKTCDKVNASQPVPFFLQKNNYPSINIDTEMHSTSNDLGNIQFSQQQRSIP